MTTQSSRAVPRDEPLILNHKPRYFATHDKSYSEGFKEHVRKTGSPETYPGLYYLPVEKSWDFSIHADETINRFDKAPCPVCWHRRQFDRKVVLIFIPEKGVYAAIGSNCADKAKMKAARAEYHKTQAELQARETLKRLLPKLPRWVEALRRAAKAESEVRYSLTALMSNAAAQRNLIRRSLSTDRLLTSTVRRPEGGLASYSHGPINGANTLTVEIFALSKEPLEDMRGTANLYAPASLDPDTYIQEFLEEGSIVRVAAALSKIETDYRHEIRRLVDFRSFNRVENIDAIDNWSRRLADEIAFRIKVNKSEGRSNLVFTTNSGRAIATVPVLDSAFDFEENLPD